MTEQNAYARAGVNVAEGERAVELMKEAVLATHGPEVMGGIGGFAGLYDVSALTSFTHPVLATSTDGVGTKVALAQALDVHDSIGQDLVGMVVDDLVVCGAKPLFMTDYIACGQLVPERVAAIVGGIALGCEIAGCALVGGETAEHPGLMEADEYDVAGAATGVVDRDEILGPDRVADGDALVAMGSSGLHSNGYSLARAVVAQQGWGWEAHVDDLGCGIGEALLTPTRIYAKDCLALADFYQVHAFAHITGGGLASNLARSLPDGLGATIERSTWTPAPVFQVLQEAGSLSRSDMDSALNMGVGMVAVLPADQADDAVARLTQRGVSAWRCGTVHTGESVELVGDHS